jgi:hypothetical protein
MPTDIMPYSGSGVGLQLSRGSRLTRRVTRAIEQLRGDALLRVVRSQVEAGVTVEKLKEYGYTTKEAMTILAFIHRWGLQLSGDDIMLFERQMRVAEDHYQGSRELLGTLTEKLNRI